MPSHQMNALYYTNIYTLNFKRYGASWFTHRSFDELLVYATRMKVNII